MVSSSKQQTWETFVDWCGVRGLCPAPANPWTLAAYVRFLEAELRPDTIRRRIAQIGQVHFQKLRKRPDRHPLVIRTIESIKKRNEKPAPEEIAPPLFRAEDFLEPSSAPTPRAPISIREIERKAPRRTLRTEPKLVRRKRV